MGNEIERKFKLRTFPSHLKWSSKVRIIQGYLAIQDDDIEVRIRKAGKKFIQTIKSDGSLVRKEVEIKLNSNQFQNLWQLTEGKRIIKDRYICRVKNLKVEVDVYLGNLKKLIIAEIEFPSMKMAKEFDPPSWFDEEVTYNPKFKNKNLAKKFRP